MAALACSALIVTASPFISSQSPVGSHLDSSSGCRVWRRCHQARSALVLIDSPQQLGGNATKTESGDGGAGSRSRSRSRTSLHCTSPNPLRFSLDMPAAHRPTSPPLISPTCSSMVHSSGFAQGFSGCSTRANVAATISGNTTVASAYTLTLSPSSLILPQLTASSGRAPASLPSNSWAVLM
jgi:hypothetical protein